MRQISWTICRVCKIKRTVKPQVTDAGLVIEGQLRTWDQLLAAYRGNHTWALKLAPCCSQDMRD